MKVIDLLNKVANGDIDEVPNKFVFAQQTFTKKGSYIEDEDGDNIFESLLTDFSNLDDEIEIIEELEEPIKLKKLCHQIVGYYDNDTNRIVRDFNKQIKQISENINTNVEIINKAFENQNKIVRELKANKENE